MGELDTLYGILHLERQESFDNLINGLACHYERLGKGATGAHAADKYTLEYVAAQLTSLRAAEQERAAKQARDRILDDFMAWIKLPIIKRDCDPTTLRILQIAIEQRMADDAQLQADNGEGEVDG
jgi:hypothetical protein